MDKSRNSIKIAGSGRSRPLREGATLARIGAVLTVAAIAMSALGHVAAAENLHHNNKIGIPLAPDEALSADKDKLSKVFESRWPSSTHDFAVGADGVLRVAGRTAERSSADSNYAFVDNSNLGARISSTLSQNDTIAADAKGMDARECGPSNVSSETVKGLVDAAAAKHGVDATFAEAIAWSESGFDRSRNSPKGARGAMQLMPATAVELGVQDVCDPADNIDGGVRHLRAMLDEFGNPLLAAAAYNAGSEAIYRYGGVPPFPETVGFVARVVNFTLGLEPPHGRAKEKAGPADETTVDAEVGVITARKPGAFVGGVMQF